MSVKHLHADLDARRQSADARWTALTAQVAHLARALALQRRTVGTQFDLLRAVASPERHRLRGPKRVADALVSRVVDPRAFWALVYQRDQDGVRQLATDHAPVVDSRSAGPFPLVAIEDLASSDLHRAAPRHGFKRLPLKRIEG